MQSQIMKIAASANTSTSPQTHTLLFTPSQELLVLCTGCILHLEVRDIPLSWEDSSPPHSDASSEEHEPPL